MRLVRTDEKKYAQGKETSDDYRAVTKALKSTSDVNEAGKGQYYADIWLKRRSLYIMR